MPKKCEWSNLPSECKEAVLQRCTENTRNALKACSSDCRALVREAKLKIVENLDIGVPSFPDEDYKANQPDTWIIRTHKRMEYSFPDPVCIKFKTFEKFQEALKIYLASIHAVKNLNIKKMNSDTLLELWSDCRGTILVENLNIEIDNSEHLAKVIAQVQAKYLRRIAIDGDEGDESIYDLPQLINAETVKVYNECSITSEQLTKLNAHKIVIRQPECSLHKYVDLCLLEAKTTLREFKFCGEEALEEWKRWYPKGSKKCVVVKTSKPKLNLKLMLRNGRLVGKMEFESERTASKFLLKRSAGRADLRVIHTFKVLFCSEEEVWNVKVRRSNHPSLKYKFQSFQDVQKRVDKVFKHADVIYRFEINFENSTEKLKWRRWGKRITIRHLEIKAIDSETSIYGLLKKVDPYNLRELTVASKVVEKSIFKLKHVYHVEYLALEGLPLPRDDNLMGINAKIYEHYDENEDHQSIITSSGLNQFMKQRLCNLNQKRYKFEISLLPDNLDENDIFQGFNVILFEENANWTERVIDSIYPEYVLVVTFNNRTLHGIRELRSDALR